MHMCMLLFLLPIVFTVLTMKSERLSILVSPEDKSRIAEHAAKLNLSTGELVRRAVSAYEPDNDHEELAVLAATLTEAVSQAERQLDASQDLLDQFDDRLQQIRLQAIKSARDENIGWPFPVNQLHKVAE